MPPCPSLLFIILSIWLWPKVAPNWLYLGLMDITTSGPYTRDLRLSGGQRGCTRIPGLNPYQMTMCQDHPNAMPSVSHGARTGVGECIVQFKNERWNCTTLRVANDSEHDVFGATRRAANQETAFLYAITSAGLVAEITRACSAGNLTECGCDRSYRHMGGVYSVPGGGDRTGAKWRWGGCSDNIYYGMKFSKKFLDEYEKNQHTEVGKRVAANHLMNLHNNDAGRKAVARLMKIDCRCHGVSGSCEFKTCWRAMSKFNVVGELLKARWQNAVRIKRRAKRKLRRRQKSERKVPIREDQLVYIHPSPTYCEANPALGIPGTQGRECNHSSYGADSCSELCCGRGFNTRMEQRVERCQCKFVWCCYVKCKTCSGMVEVTTCK